MVVVMEDNSKVMVVIEEVMGNKEGVTDNSHMAVEIKAIMH
jgi:hypothetical protein